MSALEVVARHVVMGMNVGALVPAHVVDVPHDEKVLVVGAEELVDDDASGALDERHEDEALCWKSPPSVGRHLLTPAVAGADAASLELAVVAYHTFADVGVVGGLNVTEEVEASHYCCCDGGSWMPWIERRRAVGEGMNDFLQNPHVSRPDCSMLYLELVERCSGEQHEAAGVEEEVAKTPWSSEKMRRRRGAGISPQKCPKKSQS